ncbi:hypothetical protein [Actinophytocola sediminis]
MPQRARLRWYGHEADTRMRAGAVRGLRKAAEHVLGESRREVPLEEATLERSGVASVDAESLTAAVAYDTPYAVRQHEELDYQHDEGRKAKYLEDPLERESDTVGQIVQSEIRRAL